MGIPERAEEAELEIVQQYASQEARTEEGDDASHEGKDGESRDSGLEIVDQASDHEARTEEGDDASYGRKDGEFESRDSGLETVDQSSDHEATTDEGDHVSERKGGVAESEDSVQGEEEQEECGFCLFMKGGPCGERFSIWQNCVDTAEKSGDDIVEKCHQTTSLLKVCMEMNLEYYGPILDAEKAMEEATSVDENQKADAAAKPADSGGDEGKDKSEGEAKSEITGKVEVSTEGSPGKSSPSEAVISEQGSGESRATTEESPASLRSEEAVNS